jgi:hypothetical protein
MNSDLVRADTHGSEPKVGRMVPFNWADDCRQEVTGFRLGHAVQGAATSRVTGSNGRLAWRTRRLSNTHMSPGSQALLHPESVLRGSCAETSAERDKSPASARPVRRSVLAGNLQSEFSQVSVAVK